MNKVFLTHAYRTPMGKIGGKLAPVRTDDLLAHVLSHLSSKINFDKSLIDDVIIGCSNQAGEDNRNIARMGLILAGFPYEVPGTTINRLCGSSLDAVMTAYSHIKSGLADCIVAGGVESMSRGPLVISKAGAAYGRDQKMYDSSFGWRFTNPEMEKLFPLFGMGETAEEVQKLHNITRVDQDMFAYESHQKAHQATENGAFNDEIVPVDVKLRKSSYTVDKDECIRPDTHLDILAKLKPAFRKDGSVTAGNSSPMNDGSSAVMLASEDFIKKHGLTPLVEITGGAVRGLHPNTMGLGPVHAVKKLCEKYSMKTSDFDIIELNEAFAVQSLGCIKELDLDQSKINKRGGAIALGHPLGCSGTRILTTLVHQMKDDKSLKKGLATMCIGVGQGIALSVENCS